MTREVTVRLPEDVAARLEGEDASDYVTAAVRAQMARDERLLTDNGFRVTDEGRARFRERLAEADREWTPERRQELRERFGRVGRVA